jgi:hypothetical protein
VRPHTGVTSADLASARLVSADRYILSLDDGTPQARACERIALRLADALEVAWAPVPVPESHPREAAQRTGTLADHDWVLAVAMPWSGEGERLRQLVEAMPYPLLVVSPTAARRLMRALAISQHVVLHVAESPDPASERAAEATATAMGDWRSSLGPGEFVRRPNVDVELIVTPAAGLARRRMRRAFERAVAPLLIVPSGSDGAWPEPAAGWSAPLALVPH